MPKQATPIRQRLAKNLKALAKAEGLSGHEIAKRAKLDPKTVNNILRASHDPRLTHAEKVAGVFGLAAWQILWLDLEAKPVDSLQVQKLLEAYSKAPDNGRRAIMQVAEIASQEAV